MMGIDPQSIGAIATTTGGAQKEALTINAMKKAIDTEAQQMADILQSAQVPQQQTPQNSQVVAELTGMGQQIDIKA